MQKPTLLCSAKTNTITPGKLGRPVGFSTKASRAGVGFLTILELVCVGLYTTGGFYISLLYGYFVGYLNRGSSSPE